MTKPFYSIQAKSESVVDIFVYGIIGDSWYQESTSARQFVFQFKELEKKYDTINIRIHSPGGSVWDGLAMINTIRASKKDVHTYNEGIAMSMGATLLLSGKTAHASKNSVTMLHNALSGVIGNSKVVQKAADDLSVYDSVLAQMIADKTGKTLDDVKAQYMNYEDNLMSANKALEDGLIDVIEDYEAEDVPENVKNMSPNAMLEFFEQRPAAQFISNISAKIAGIQMPTNTQENMGLFGSDFPKLNALAKAPSATETDVVEANAELNEKGVKLVLITPENLTEANGNADAVSNAITALKTALGPDAKGTTVSELITALVADRDAQKALAEKYGDQPGEKPSAAITEKPAEGGETVKPVANEFETSFDREIKALQS